MTPLESNPGEEESATMYMIFLVLDDPDQLDQVLASWDKTGIRGATIIESTGIHRKLKQIVPMRYLFQTSEPVLEGHYTLFVIVEDEATVQACLQATEQITGDLNGPNTGILAAWPLTLVKGLPSVDKSGS